MWKLVESSTGLKYVTLEKEQRSKEWFEARKFRCTASNAEIYVTGKSNFKTLELALNELLGRSIPEPPNMAMQLGIENEKPAIDRYCKDNKVEYEDVSLCIPLWNKRQLSDSLHPIWFIAGSPDGIVTCEGKIGNLEVKFPKALYWKLRERKEQMDRKQKYGEEVPFRTRTTVGKTGRIGTDNYPHIFLSHYMQMQQCMAITGKPWCHYLVDNPIRDSNNPTYLEKVPFNYDFFKNFMYPELINFVTNYIIPNMSEREKEEFKGRVDEIRKICS